MRRFAWLLVLFVGCATSAGDLPLNGPYSDAGPVDTGAGTPLGDSGLPVFVNGSSTGSTIATGVTTGATTATTGVATTASSGMTVVSSVDTSMMTTATSVASTTMTHSTSMASTSNSVGAPTWVYLYNTYLSASGSTIGTCDGGSCHYHSECSDPLDCYNWLVVPGDYTFTADGSYPIFSWDGGHMPKEGPSKGSEPQADADFAAWVAAGSLNDG